MRPPDNKSTPAAKHVVVILRRPPQHPRSYHALRSAVGYLTANLRVTLVLGGPAEVLLQPDAALLKALPAETVTALLRPLGTLRALGHAVLAASAVDLEAVVAGADAAVMW